VTFEHIFAFLPFWPLLVFPVWNFVWLLSGVRGGRWMRPRWFMLAGCTLLYLLALVWVGGIEAGGLDPENACRLCQQPYDEAFLEAHRAEAFRLFPLSTHCNDTYDLVPVWVNPALVVISLLVVASVVGAVWTWQRPSCVRREETGSQ